MSDVTRLLNTLSETNDHSSGELLEAIYGELRQMASAKMAGERSDHTLQPTALVNEAYIRLAGSNTGWASRRHFFGAASEAMRRILIESARRKKAAKRDAKAGKTEFRDSMFLPVQDDEKLLEVHEVLKTLEAEDPQRAELVKLRFFVGLTVCEIADLQGLSERTVARHWELAKVWLIRALRNSS